MTSPTYWRNAIVVVEVSRAWLTVDGEYEDTNEGWTELENQLKAALRKMTQGKELEVTFEEWAGLAEEL